MRTSAFWRLMDDEFGGGYSRTLARTIVLADLGGRTPEEALGAGISPRDIWVAVCDLQDVPPERRLGKDIAPK